MSVKWFGKKYSAPIYEQCPSVKTPVGAACVLCEEPIAEGDDGMLFANGPPAHRECFLRAVLGSVAHQQKRCSCFGGKDCNEEGQTDRQAARAAAAYHEEHG